ncbi:hypothetical protein S40293_04429 [Stachybotrys chartarum IBT 40293]|nr:hypothetical protein S40293_04429 [Stachybotrys chartarum IBT 40293]
MSETYFPSYPYWPTQYRLHATAPTDRRTVVAITMAAAVLSVAICVVYTLRRQILANLPRWCKPFASEEPPPNPSARRWTPWTLILNVISLAGLVLSGTSICMSVINTKSFFRFVGVVPWLAAQLITTFDRPIKAPLLLLVQYLTIFTSDFATYSVAFLGHFPKAIDGLQVAGTLLCCIAIIVICNMPLRDPTWGVSDIGGIGAVPSNAARSPEDNLSLLRWWTMSWVNPLANVRARREITVNDIWQLPHSFQHTRLYLAFRELDGKLLHRLIHANGLDIILATILALVDQIGDVTIIRLTSTLYKALDNGDTREAIYWTLVMLAFDVVRQFAQVAGNWYGRKSYERSRGETFIALFIKLLTRAVPGSDAAEKGLNEEGQYDEMELKPRKRLAKFYSRLCGQRKPSPERESLLQTQQTQQASNAKVVNLVRNDTYEISQRIWEFGRLVSMPVKLGFTIYYLIDIMGWSSCIGVGLMLIFFTSNAFLVKKVVSLSRDRTVLSDKRAQAISHFVEASRPLKLNGWTSTWADRIMRFRKVEMAKRLVIANYGALIGAVNAAGGAVYPLASIALYTLYFRQELSNGVIWPSLQLFAQLQTNMQTAFQQITDFWKATIPVERVHKYMAEPDQEKISNDYHNHQGLEFLNASFAWQSSNKQVLEDIDLKFRPGLTVVRGKVGSGKSSLLLAALNEMQLLKGNIIKSDEPIGYAQQQPWLESKTIRENILFNRPFDVERYHEVLLACALYPDIGTFTSGDHTKLEEGGIGLSGGQKARVALARAVYSPATTLLLDDPLAALDHDTASLIVKRLFSGKLAEDRTIVLVTHRDDLVMGIAQQVVDMDNGRAVVLSPEEYRRRLQHLDQDSETLIEEEDESDEDRHEYEASSTIEEPEEASPEGGVPLSVYTRYMRAGGWWKWFGLLFFFLVTRFSKIAKGWLLEAWGHGSVGNDIGPIHAQSYWGLPEPTRFPRPWLYALAAISVVEIVSFAVAQLILARISVDAAQGLFKAAVERVGKATFRYYDTTPTGQLKNRLISDMAMVDGGIMSPLETFVYYMISLIMSLLAIMLHQPALLIILFIVTLLFVHFFKIYVPISRSLRRIEMRYLTPIIANIGVLQEGLVTIRAFQVEENYKKRHLLAVDDFQKYDHFFWGMAFWLRFRISVTSYCTRTVMTLAMIWYRTPASAIGFVLTQTEGAMTSIQSLCQAYAELQLDAVSLERVEQLNNIPEEPTGNVEPPQDWPASSDAVSFGSVTFKYGDDLPTVLHQVSFDIPGGSSCAVLGRTGSGKSTVANVLLATELPREGIVMIGGIDLAHIDRTTLRKRITYIQQDPILFPGTLRDNIDPEGKFAESECENAIHRVLGSDWSLDSTIDAAGKNLSQGQRQLVGIARAVLRRSGLVIMDEATASIDRATAATVQRILREELSQSTVITIAHRLEAVEDASWQLRLDHGRVVRCGPATEQGSCRDGEESEQE